MQAMKRQAVEFGAVEAEGPAGAKAISFDPKLLVCPGIIEMEGRAKGMEEGKVRGAKENYAELVHECVGMLKETYVEKPANVIEAMAIWHDIGGFFWSNFSYAPTDYAIDSFGALGKGTPAFSDCDISVYFAAEIFTQLGAKASVVGGDGHALLKIGLAGKTMYFETTEKLMTAAMNEKEFAEKYPGRHEEYAFDGNYAKVSSYLQFMLAVAHSKNGERMEAARLFEDAVKNAQTPEWKQAVMKGALEYLHFRKAE